MYIHVCIQMIVTTSDCILINDNVNKRYGKVSKKQGLDITKQKMINHLLHQEIYPTKNIYQIKMIKVHIFEQIWKEKWRFA